MALFVRYGSCGDMTGANTAIIIIMNKIIAPITTLLLRRHFLSIIAAELLFNVSKPVTTLIFDSRIDRAVCQVHDQVYYQEHYRKQQDAGLYNRIIIAQDRRGRISSKTRP